jgi:hypothetical protein
MNVNETQTQLISNQTIRAIQQRFDTAYQYGHMAIIVMLGQIVNQIAEVQLTPQNVARIIYCQVKAVREQKTLIFPHDYDEIVAGWLVDILGYDFVDAVIARIRTERKDLEA